MFGCDGRRAELNGSGGFLFSGVYFFRFPFLFDVGYMCFSCRKISYDVILLFSHLIEFPVISSCLLKSIERDTSCRVPDVYLIYHVIIYSFVKWLRTVVLSIRTYKSQKCCAAYVIPHVTHILLLLSRACHVEATVTFVSGLFRTAGRSFRTSF
ncbi:hypothetical protein J3E69DRAFT_337065 [Trichoderma sp. SZMC 28015]